MRPAPPAAARVNRQPLALATATLRQPGDVDVEDRASCSVGQRADHAERGEVDALELEAGLEGGGGALDHLAADGDDDDARALGPAAS